MFTIIETLWRLVILICVAGVQAVAAVLGAIALLFGNASEFLRKFSNKILKKLNNGNYEESMKSIATK